MAENKLTATLDDLPSARVVVVGDVMTDRWVYGRVDRISPEAPVPVFVQESFVDRPGGAGNVAENLSALGIGGYANVLVGCGRWAPGLKTRFVVGRQQIFRHDAEDIQPITPREEDDAYRLATHPATQCLILSDYGKGMLTEHLCRRLILWARHINIPIVVDPKGPDWAKYDGATIITPNQAEWSAASEFNDPIGILITRGAKGMMLVEGANGLEIPAQAREVFDVTGAGDTVVAILGACLAAGFDMLTAAKIANAGAGVVVGKPGTATCSLDELKEACSNGKVFP